jgi:ApbE superfamily uncharacterized protein (UPF0280 family)
MQTFGSLKSGLPREGSKPICAGSGWVGLEFARAKHDAGAFFVELGNTALEGAAAC